MGQIISAVGTCVGLKKSTKNQVTNEYLTVLVVGDHDVGKTTLIDNYIEEHTESGAREESAPLASAPKNTDRLRIKEADQLFTSNGRNFSVKLSLVEVNGSMDAVGKQFRDSYYKQAKIVFIIYNISKVDSLHAAENIWHKEILDSVGSDKKRGEEMQIVLVGVNPECRDALEASDIYSPTGDGDNAMLEFKRNTLRKSIKKGEGDRVSQRLTHKNSQKKTKHYEVQKDRTKVLQFFSNVVQDYVLSKQI